MPTLILRDAGLEPRAPSQDEGGWMLPLRVPFGRRRDTCVPPLEQRCDATEQRCGIARFLCSDGAVPRGDGTASRDSGETSLESTQKERSKVSRNHAALSRVRNIRSMVMKGVSKIVAALVFGLAVSALATPSFAQRAEGMSGARAQAGSVQQGGREICGAHLGRRRDLHLPRLHDKTRPAGVAGGCDKERSCPSVPSPACGA